MCVCVVGQVFTFFLGCNCCCCVAVVVILLVVVVVATHFFFAATAIYCIFHLPCERTHTHMYLPHTHVLATHTARCSENFAVKLASLLKQTKFA